MAQVVLAQPQAVYQNRDRALREQYDHRACWKKVVDTIVSFVRELWFGLGLLYQWAFGVTHQPGMQEITRNLNSRGLVVLIHGLRGTPAIWASQLALLNADPRVDLFAPQVVHQGICSLEEAARPIVPTVLGYVQRNPGKPVCLLGVSNGSRIATWLETEMRRDAPHTPVRISTIAGVHFGSSRMNLVERIGIGKWFYPPVLGQELRYGSQAARDLLERVIAPLPGGCAPRDYEFYATTEDQSVPDLDSSLPQLNRGEQYHVVHGESHDSIVAAVAREQVRSSMEWINTMEVV